MRNVKKIRYFFSTLDFALEADVSDSSIRAYLSGTRIPNDRIKVLKMGLAMQLSTPYLLDLLNKYDDNKRNITNENILFNSIIYNCGETRTSLEDVYYVLKANNNEGLLKMSNTWLTNHRIV